MDPMQVFLKYGWIANLVLVGIVAILAADTVNGYVIDKYLPAGPAEQVRFDPGRGHSPAFNASRKSIVNRDIFDAVADKAPADTEPGDGDTAELKDTSLRLELLGTTYYDFGDEWNFATIKNKQDQEIGVYNEGMEVTDGAVLHEVQYDRVILARGEDYEVLRLAEKETASSGKDIGPTARLNRMTPEERAEAMKKKRERYQRLQNQKSGNDLSDRIKMVGDNSYVIEKSAIDEALGDLNSIITQARVIPNYTGSGADRTIDGFRIYRIKPGSIFQALGLQNGDVIKSINGEIMNNVETGLSLLSELRNQTKFNLAIERRRNPMEMNYEVE